MMALSSSSSKHMYKKDGNAIKQPWTQKAFSMVDKNLDTIDYQNKTLAAHAFLYCESSAILFRFTEMKYGIMMQLRFDGTFGFPGGLIEVDEVPVEGLNRELQEEIGLAEKYFFCEDDYFRTWVDARFIGHFYLKKFSEKDFIEIEKAVLHSKDWGGETLGVVRVPVHTMKRHCQVPPFVGFLSHKFIGNAQEELIESILHEKILSTEDMLTLWDTYSNETKK